jgi:uncharacterized protein YjeT (DUF2065 family)
MGRIIGGSLLVAIAVTFIVNGACMLISPRAWLRLPQWLPTAGTAFRERYGTEKALIGIRMTGAIFLAGITWVVYDYFSR